MLDIGWSELLVIAIVLIVVVGPKDLPPMIRAFGKMMAGLRRMGGEFRSQFDEAMRDADLDEVRKTIADAKNLNPTNSLRDAFDPLRKAGEDLKTDLRKATTMPPAKAELSRVGTEPAKPVGQTEAAPSPPAEAGPEEPAANAGEKTTTEPRKDEA